jgi:TusA-related sulfurtransferase
MIDSSSIQHNSNDHDPLIADAHLDLRGTPCPINFVRTKLKLEQMPANSLLEVWLDPGEPVEQVPDSLVMEGYQIECIEERKGYSPESNSGRGVHGAEFTSAHSPSACVPEGAQSATRQEFFSLLIRRPISL